ncbi:MAG: transglutaminase family protein [Alphaproteobacteria bacterium]|nr:transglutaminase family protein [Alphaproteobacteria bacterium]
MLYRVRHLTTYEYSKTVTSSQHVLRLRPRLTDNQVCASSEVALNPAPLRRTARDDYFGNRMEIVNLDDPHLELTIDSTSLVRVSKRKPRDIEMTAAWETIADTLSLARTEPEIMATNFLFDTPLTRADTTDLVSYAAEDFAPGRAVALAARDLMNRVRRDIKYKPGVTDISTPIDKIFELKAGVCQDQSHFMLAVLRARGLAARYVSGYLLTYPPPGRPRMQGADQSHAWVQVWCPPLGWIDFDPTNGVLPDDEHITVAYGRDYADISPISGIMLGGGEHEVEVKVDVAPLEEANAA